MFSILVFDNDKNKFGEGCKITSYGPPVFKACSKLIFVKIFPLVW